MPIRARWFIGEIVLTHTICDFTDASWNLFPLHGAWLPPGSVALNHAPRFSALPGNPVAPQRCTRGTKNRGTPPAPRSKLLGFCRINVHRLRSRYRCASVYGRRQVYQSLSGDTDYTSDGSLQTTRFIQTNHPLRSAWGRHHVMAWRMSMHHSKRPEILNTPILLVR